LVQGYDRLAGALAHPGYDISDQAVGNILKRRGIPTSPRASQNDDLEGIYPHAHGRVVGYGLLHQKTPGGPIVHGGDG
jgi:hypothetical protein